LSAEGGAAAAHGSGAPAPGTLAIEHFHGVAGAGALRVRGFADPLLEQRARYLATYLERGVGPLVGNASKVRMEVLHLGGELLPLIVNDGNEEDCYLVSPIGFYVHYVRDELRLMPQEPLLRAFHAFVTLVGGVLRGAGLNRVVQVNNWLFSTSFQVRFNAAQLRALTGWLLARFPDHALLYRGILEDETEQLSAFRERGWERVVSRPVFVRTERHHRTSKKIRQRLEKDRRLLETMEVTGALTPAERARFPVLYEGLYRQKYSPMNPAFTGAYFENLLDSGVGTARGVRCQGALGAFMTSALDRDGSLIVMTVGRDLSIALDESPLYRVLVAAEFDRAAREQRPLLLSTGVARFKKGRGAVQRIEYDLVYTRHCGRRRQLAWGLVRRAFDFALRNLDTEAI
jgi:hypothetical protein